MQIPTTYTPRGVSFIIHGRPKNVFKDHPSYNEIVEALKDNDIEELEHLTNVSSFVAKITNGDVQLSDDQVRYKGQKVPDYLAIRMIEHHKSGLPIEPLCRFAEKLMRNPNIDVRDDLYKWMENGDMPIYPDGDFAAYKAVKPDFTPHNKGPYGQDQSVGMVVEMPRSEVNSDRDVTCSTGLHFCSYDYIPQMYNGNTSVIIILKIDPADVCAIPTDYNLSKGRTCRFEVVGTVNWEIAPETLKGNKVYETPVVVEDKEVDEVLVITHEKSGQSFTYDELKEYLDNYTNTGLSKLLDIPRSTIFGWREKYGS